MPFFKIINYDEVCLHSIFGTQDFAERGGGQVVLYELPQNGSALTYKDTINFDNNTICNTFDFTNNSKNMYLSTRSCMLNLFGTPPNNIRRVNIATGSRNTVVSNYFGEIRRGKDTAMYVCNAGFTTVKKITNPNYTTTVSDYTVITETNWKLTGVFPLQAHRIYPRIETQYARFLGNKRYEITDHLNDVRVVISDIKEPLDTVNGPHDFYADIKSATDYFPGGMLQPGRSFNSNTYRFGFNGKEKDDEWTGVTGATYDYGFRIYDSRVARFLSVDPLTKDYPSWTPYAFAMNSPISGVDLDGLEFFYVADGTLLGKVGTSQKVMLVDQKYVKQASLVIGFANKINTSSDDFSRFANKFSCDVGLDNDELNTRAFMGTITRLEGGAYNRKIGGGTYTGKEHPGGQKLRFGKEYKYVSAAGSYQITEGTYKGYKKLDPTITDFSPENQDKIAVDIIDASNALEDVKSGNLDKAIPKLRSQWSSLPGATEETNDADATKTIFKEEVVKELHNRSSVKTAQGQLDLNE